ncbi:MAG: S8 family peptidase [Burkholderiaceae bacterium]|jgi:serine protease|nr:S8 family peptidase [Burkholderiaceae bacterium]
MPLQAVTRTAQQAALALVACCVLPAGATPPGGSASVTTTAAPTTAAAAPVARGLIVRLAASSASGRESAQTVRERLAAVAREAGLPSARAAVPVGGGHHLLPFAKPLSGVAVEDALRRVRLHPQVAHAEPDARLKRLSTLPNDPYFTSGAQWYLGPVATGGAAAMNLPLAWDASTGSAHQVVAVLDSGALFAHPDLRAKWLPGYDMVSTAATSGDGDGRDTDAADPGDWVSSADLEDELFDGCVIEDSSWHGTAVAGAVAASANNGEGIAGVDWGARILPVRVSGKCGAWLSDVTDGLRWAAGLRVDGAPANPHPARIINLSFGGAATCDADSVYQLAINEASAAGALVVVAGGNENGPLTRPADCAGVLSVGAALQDGAKSAYSNYGANLGIMAPGGAASYGDAGATETLVSTRNFGLTTPGAHGYGAVEGTSFSAPLAAGVASLMLAVNPALSPAEIVARIQQGARAFPVNPARPACRVGAPVSSACNCTQQTCGAGLLDASAAVQLAHSPAVSIAAVDGAQAGTAIALDGRSSAAAIGSHIVSWAWSVTSGTPVDIRDADSALAQVTLPAHGVWVFRLLVTDSAGRSADNYVTVTATGDGNFGDAGDGGGATGWLWGAGLWALALLGWRRKAAAVRASAH